jgi:membrane protease YdiL (CAAX protease family)
MQPELYPAQPTAVPEPATGPQSAGPGWVSWFTLVMLIAAPLSIAALWARGYVGPGSLSKKLAPPASTQHWTALLMSALMVYLACGIGAQLVMRDVLPWPQVVVKESNAGRGAIALGFHGFGIPAALTLAVLASAKGLSSIFRARDLWIGLASFAAIYPLVLASSTALTFILTRLQGEAPNPIQHEALNRIVSDPSDPWVRVIIASAVIGAPIVEEIMYRMLLQTALIQACRNAWTGIALTSVLFALSHLGGGAVPWHATIPLFVLSVGLGVLQVRTGRVGPCIVVHMVFNAVNVGLTLAAR